MSRNILKLPDVMKKTGLSKAGLYALIQKGKFPRPVKLGTRASGWIDDEIDDWIGTLIKDRDQ